MNKLFLLAFVILSVETHSQRLSSVEKEILRLQDQRSLGDGKLLLYLSDSKPEIRYRAAIACANIQDSLTVSSLIPLLKDSDESVRAAVSFALGEIGAKGSQEYLLKALHEEREATVISRVLEALGRLGDIAALDSVIDYMPKDQTLKRDQAIAVARFALRNVKSERSVWFCFDLLQGEDYETQWKALYALWRSAPQGVIDVEISKRRERLSMLATSLNSDVRLHLVTLLGRTKSSDAIDLLKALDEFQMSGKDWKVQVQLVRSFGALVQREPELIGRILHLLDSPSPHVMLAALQSLTNLMKDNVQSPTFSQQVRQKLIALVGGSSKSEESVQGEALVALGKHFPEELEKLSSILNSKDASPRVKAKFLEAISHKTSAKNLDTMLAHTADESPRVSMAAWDFIKRMFSPSSINILQSEYARWFDIENILYEWIRRSLSRQDMGVSTLVAGAVSDSSFRSVFKNREIQRKLVRELMTAYEHFSTPDDVEAMQAILVSLGTLRDTSACQLLEKAIKDPDRTVSVEAAKALERITGRDYSGQVPRPTAPKYADYDWQALDSISEKQKVIMTTSRGDVTFQFLKKHAPFTVLSFTKLIKRGFFVGLIFHRVVPNFVVQGGDPRGDGWGGPGYSIRSEFSLIGYDRGTVGVASAGKDTEGCQFFITHSPQPHLDGRYTVFGTVEAGMEVVDKLQVGDKILAIRLSE
ncbi:MAG: peptidylprolyl isomerase [Ignavibacteriales bacterium]|nr:peptidylprolyl isomerase [Ignavibacteriales bacterium]